MPCHRGPAPRALGWMARVDLLGKEACGRGDCRRAGQGVGTRPAGAADQPNCSARRSARCLRSVRVAQRGIVVLVFGFEFPGGEVLARQTRPAERMEAHMSSHQTTVPASVGSLRPAPVASPHVAKPPMFDRWGLGPGRADKRDKREYNRRSVRCDLWLIDAASQSVLRCKTNDISDAGLRAVAPIGFGLAVGQRYEVRIAASNVGGAMSAHLATPLGYGTVIRTEIKTGDDKPDRVGCAVRFDVPQLIPV